MLLVINGWFYLFTADNLCRRKDKHYFGKFQNNFPKDVMHLFPDNSNPSDEPPTLYQRTDIQYSFPARTN